MNKGGIGIGSASIVLVFAVLCLTIFSLITFIVAENAKSLVDAEKELVVGYYNADAQAELILAELLEYPPHSRPAGIQGVELHYEYDFNRDQEVLSFSCPIPDSTMVLLVRVLFHDDSYEILSWRMHDTSDWLIDDGMNLWLG